MDSDTMWWAIFFGFWLLPISLILMDARDRKRGSSGAWSEEQWDDWRRRQDER